VRRINKENVARAQTLEYVFRDPLDWQLYDFVDEPGLADERVEEARVRINESQARRVAVALDTVENAGR
jgi:hypothetical protein